MKVSEAIKILAMFDPNMEVELVFPNDHEVPPVTKPKKPLTEGEMTLLPNVEPRAFWW